MEGFSSFVSVLESKYVPPWICLGVEKNSSLAVQQEQPGDLLTFLAETTAGTTYGESVNALAQYARAQKLQAREHDQHQQRLNYLDISAEAEITKVRRGDFFTFQVTLQISQPTSLWELRVYQFGGTPKEFDYMTRIARKDIRASLSTYTRPIKDEDLPKGDQRLPVARNLAFEIELEDYLSWGGQHSGSSRLVEWPDIEVNSKMRWSFPIDRRLPQIDSQKSQDDEIMRNIRPLELENNSSRDAVLSKKLQNMFKRMVPTKNT